MNKSSLYREAFHEALRYREDIVGRMGDDFATTAAMEWNRDHWWSWVADRTIQHITGERFWVELESRSFASVTRETPDRMRVLHHLRDIQRRLAGDGLSNFAEKESLREQWASSLNRLLDA